MVVSVDGLLERLGNRYQLLVFLVLGSCLVHVALNHHLHHSYLATPPHHCKTPEGWSDSLSLPTVMVRAPQGPEALARVAYSRCEMFKDPLAHRKGTKPCVYGYVFTLRGLEWSIVAEWGLVCERVWIKRWVSTSYLFGLVVGGLLFGFLADRFGRRNLLVVSIATVGCLGVALHFVRRLIVFLSLRFIQSIFIQGVFVTSWALVGELFPPKWRCRALVAVAMTRPLGVAMGALTALFVQHWRAVQLAVSLPLLISLMYCWMIPESLRWLLARGKTRRARQVAAQLARHNLLVLPPTAHAQMDHLAAHVYQDVPWGSLATLFKTPRLRRHTFVVTLMWLAVSLADSGFRNDLPSAAGPSGLPTGRPGSVLGGPGHLGLVLGAGVEAGAVVLAAVFTTQLYRRAFLVIQLLVAAALALGVTAALQLLHDRWLDVDALATALRFLGVLAMGGARVGLGVVTVEVVPTIARGSAVGLCAAHAAVGEMCAPLLAMVADMTYPSVPWVASAASCLLAALLALLLPETSGTTLPDVVEEAEVIGLWFRGEVIKSCDSAYGRSPFWVEVDGLIVSRSASDAGPDDDDDRFASLERALDSQLHPERSPTGARVSRFGRGAGSSHLMALPRVPARRKDRNGESSRSSYSLPSSGSIVSLVDVSKINGNNSDSTDSNSSADRAHSNELGNDKKEVSSAENPEGATQSQGAGFSNRDQGRRVSEEEGKREGIEEFMASGNLSSYSIENDVSISVCSLKFKHIRRPVSPTDRRMKSKNGSLVTRSTSERRESRTLIEEYISRNFSSSKEDISTASTSSLTELSTDASDGTRMTKPSAVLQECLRIARNKENATKEENRKINVPKKSTASASKENNLISSIEPPYPLQDDAPQASSQTQTLVSNSRSTKAPTGHSGSRIEPEKASTKSQRDSAPTPSKTGYKTLSQLSEENSPDSLVGTQVVTRGNPKQENKDKNKGSSDNTTVSDVREQDFVFRKAIVMTDLDETNL